MASITIRNLDDEGRTLPRTRAARNDRSMEEEVRVILREPPQFEHCPAGAIPMDVAGELIRNAMTSR